MKHQLDVFYRVIAAIFGGYCLSVLFSFGWVPVLMQFNLAPKAEAVMVAAMLSYLVYFCVIIFCFCRKTFVLLLRDLMILACVCIGPYFVLGSS